MCIAMCVCVCMKISHKCVRKCINGNVCLHVNKNISAGAMYGTYMHEACMPLFMLGNMDACM